jgi:hypothetical protein
MLSHVGAMRHHGCMRDGEDEGGTPAPPVPPVRDDAGEYDLDTPNCPECLVRMEAEESPNGEPYWACTECGLVAVA